MASTVSDTVNNVFFAVSGNILLSRFPKVTFNESNFSSALTSFSLISGDSSSSSL